MTRNEKDLLITELSATLADSSVVYLADVSAMTVESSNNLRRQCFQSNVSLRVVKNTLLRKAMERVEGKDFSPLYSTLVGNTSVMIAEVGNVPARVIKDFRKKGVKPGFKGAWVDHGVYVGEDYLETLVTLKSKNELLGDIILLLQSPAKNVISGLKSGGDQLAGLLKAMSEREG